MEEKAYLVRWEIDIDATSPEDAAEKALKIMRDKESVATVFSVIELAEAGDWKVVDLD